MAYALSARSVANLVGVHPKLQSLMLLSVTDSPLDFGIASSTVRTKEQQAEFVRTGHSTTMNSLHIPHLIKGEEHLGQVSEAVDLIYWRDGRMTWEWEDITPVADHIKQIAKELNIQIVWGGDWRTFKDGPHYQLRRT